MDIITGSATSLTIPHLCMKLGQVLKILRLNKNKTQAEIAHECQCSIVTIQKIESGHLGTAIVYVLRYIEAVNGYHIIRGMDDIRQYPSVIKPSGVKYSQRPSKKHKYRKP